MVSAATFSLYIETISSQSRSGGLLGLDRLNTKVNINYCDPSHYIIWIHYIGLFPFKLMFL